MIPRNSIRGCVTKTKTLSNFNQNKRKINNIWIWYVHWFDISRLWYFDYSEIVQATDIYDSSMVSELAIVLISSLKGVGIFKKSAYSTKLSLSVRSSHAFKPEILWSKAFALESWLLLRWRKKSICDFLEWISAMSFITPLYTCDEKGVALELFQKSD